MVRKLARRVFQLVVYLVGERVEKDWRAQVVLQLLAHVHSLIVQQAARRLCLSFGGDWIWEQLSLDLSFKAPAVDIVLELHVLLEHLRYGC